MTKSVKAGLENDSERTFSVTTRALMQVQLKEESKKSKKTNKCLFIVYCVFSVLLLVMALARFSSLVAHLDFRNDITTFPAGCSSWAEANGCTYIVMANDCTRPESIATE